ncbi:MAG TPA: hypothetical protein ENN80_01000 [Candidatus Hydrogenedentes bacterium]|nr:hypothetical protein [Candidatus Hydrogenedentota bacterium]
MKKALTKRDAVFEDLPLFRMSREQQIWEALPRRVQREAVRLLSELLRHYAVSSQKGEEGHE